MRRPSARPGGTEECGDAAGRPVFCRRRNGPWALWTWLPLLGWPGEGDFLEMMGMVDSGDKGHAKRRKRTKGERTSKEKRAHPS